MDYEKRARKIALNYGIYDCEGMALDADAIAAIAKALRESYEAGLEAAAVVCDEYARATYAAVFSNEFDDGQAVGAEACADKIRALKEGGA